MKIYKVHGEKIEYYEVDSSLVTEETFVKPNGNTSLFRKSNYCAYFKTEEEAIEFLREKAKRHRAKANSLMSKAQKIDDFLQRMTTSDLFVEQE